MLDTFLSFQLTEFNYARKPFISNIFGYHLNSLNVLYSLCSKFSSFFKFNLLLVILETKIKFHVNFILDIGDNLFFLYICKKTTMYLYTVLGGTQTRDVLNQL